MIDLECPNCRRVGSIPQNKATERLICRKCHTVFHMGATGRAVLGEPPGVKEAHHGQPHAHGSATSVKDAITAIEWGGLGAMNPGLIGVLGVLAVIGGIVLLATLTGSRVPIVGSLGPPAQVLAEALKEGDFQRVKQLATADSADGVKAWFQAAQQLIEDLKENSSSHDVKIESLPTEENTDTGFGQVIYFISPVQGAARNDQNTRDSGVGNLKLTQITTFWTFVRGSWRLDGNRTQQEGRASSG